MKLSKIFFFLILSILVVFSACKEEEISKDITTEQPVVPEVVEHNPLVANVSASVSSSEGLDLGCFSIDLPFGLNVDGIEVQISNEADFENALQGEPEFIDFIYPLNITYPDGTTESLADGEALGEAFASCVPDGGWDYEEGDFPAYLICDLNSCYQIVYPLNLVDSEGNTYIATTEEEFVDLIAEHWDLFFEFPVNLLDEDGETVSAGSDEELFELLASCEEIDWPSDTLDWNGGGAYQFGCYEFQYPITLVGQNGDLITANDADEFISIVLNGGIMGFGFPLTLVAEDGTTIVVNSDEEMNDALYECEGVVLLELPMFILYQFATNLGLGDCYEVLYPITLLDVAGNVVTINDDTAAAVEYNNTDQWFVEFPITLLIDGVETTITDSESMGEIWESCD